MNSQSVSTILNAREVPDEFFNICPADYLGVFLKMRASIPRSISAKESTAVFRETQYARTHLSQCSKEYSSITEKKKKLWQFGGALKRNQYKTTLIFSCLQILRLNPHRKS